MAAILLAFWHICTFRRGPESIPANNTLLGLVIVGNGIVSWSASMLLQAALPVAPEITNQLSEAEIASLAGGFSLFTRVFVSLAATAGLVWAILSLMGFAARTNKTLVAIFGTDIVLTLLTATVVIVGNLIHPIVGQLAITGMFFWTVSVLGFILHKALEISWGFGIAAAIFILLFTIALSQVAISP